MQHALEWTSGQTHSKKGSQTISEQLVRHSKKQGRDSAAEFPAHGKSEDAVNVKSGNVKTTQPLAGQHQPSQADRRTDNMNLLPSTPGMTGMPTGVIPPQGGPDFNQMYQSAPTPMVNAHTPGQENMMGGMMDHGPMPANALVEGFSSW